MLRSHSLLTMLVLLLAVLPLGCFKWQWSRLKSACEEGESVEVVIVRAVVSDRRQTVALPPQYQKIAPLVAQTLQKHYPRARPIVSQRPGQRSAAIRFEIELSGYYTAGQRDFTLNAIFMPVDVAEGERLLQYSPTMGTVSVPALSLEQGATRAYDELVKTLPERLTKQLERFDRDA